MIVKYWLSKHNGYKDTADMDQRELGQRHRFGISSVEMTTEIQEWARLLREWVQNNQHQKQSLKEHKQGDWERSQQREMRERTSGGRPMYYGSQIKCLTSNKVKGWLAIEMETNAMERQREGPWLWSSGPVCGVPVSQGTHFNLCLADNNRKFS